MRSGRRLSHLLGLFALLASLLAIPAIVLLGLVLGILLAISPLVGALAGRFHRAVNAIDPLATEESLAVLPGTGRKRRAGRKAATCRMCRRPLSTPAQRNRGYCEDCPVPYDEELLERLKAWRKQRADEDDVPAYVVFSDATLEALAEVKPSDSRGLLGINGIGPAKVDKYADDLLAMLVGVSTRLDHRRSD